MPRKSRTTQKPPLLFLEQSLDGSRLQNEPEVRAALHPKSFIAERPMHENTAHSSWVSPQFEQSHLTTLPARRGRRKAHSTTSILDRSSQLSRKLCPKTSVCKFPTLSFERGPTQPSNISGQPKQTRGKKSSTASVAASASTNQQQQQPQQQQASRVASLPSRQTSKRRTRGTPDVSTSSSAAAGRPQPPPPGRPARGRRESPGPLAATSPPRAAAVETPGAGSYMVSSPPDLDTPKGLPGDRGIRSPRVYPLLVTPSQEQSQTQPETLVADTPEQDYGLRVTWRRRKGLMMALEKGGHLCKVDALVPMC
ncbi:unnamed protein product [Lota lota]